MHLLCRESIFRNFVCMHNTPMNRILFFALFILFSARLFAGGEPLSVEQVVSMSKEEVITYWKKNKIPRFITPVNNGVDVMELVYTSTLPNGTPVKASGKIFIPRGHKKSEVPMMVYHHGTDMKKDRPVNLKGEQSLCMVFAADGYLVLMPDYFGLGKGEGMHPYQHAETEAQSTIDMIRAVRSLKEKLNINPAEKVFLTGYSQGGHAAMSAHKFISERHADEIKVWASSPMSGAYDMTGAQREVMYQEYSHPGYLPFLVFGYNPIYHFFDNPSEIFKSPYDTTLAPLFDGKNGMDKVNKAMPKVPKDIFKEEVLDAYENDPEFPFKKALEQNNVYNWTPREPVMLCYCEADEQVFYKNALVAHKVMKENGAPNVKLRSSGKKFNHGQCAIYASVYTKYWFDSFRKGSKKGRKGDPMKLLVLEMFKGKLVRSR